MSYEPPYWREPHRWPPDHYQDRPAFDAYQGDQYANDQWPGEQYASEQYPGEQWAGEQYASGQYAGEQWAGGQYAGEQWAGEQWAGEGDPVELRGYAGPGVIAGAVMGFLAAAVAIGVATLAAAFFRPQASPIIAVGEAFIDRTPPALKNFAVQKFGENDKTMLLLGMYVTIALLAMTIGVIARHRVAIGVVGVAAFGLFGAFVAYTRPASKPSDVIPSIIGGVAGVLALLWLAHAAKPGEELGYL
jgi:hypothetical protein